MKRVQLPDPKSGLPVFDWLIPAGWEFEGAVRWRDSVAVPALIGFRAWNPRGSEQIECLPQIPNTWTRNVVTRALGRLGPKRHLMKLDGLEQREPMTAREALRELVVPRYRGRTADQRAGRMRGGPFGFLDAEPLSRQVPGLHQYLQGVQRRWQALQKGARQMQGLLKGADYRRRIAPGGYEHAWTNGLGEHVVTDSSFLNPNDFASGSWERLQRGR